MTQACAKEDAVDDLMEAAFFKPCTRNTVPRWVQSLSMRLKTPWGTDIPPGQYHRVVEGEKFEVGSTQQYLYSGEQPVVHDDNAEKRAGEVKIKTISLRAPCVVWNRSAGKVFCCVSPDVLPLSKEAEKETTATLQA